MDSYKTMWTKSYSQSYLKSSYFVDVGLHIPLAIMQPVLNLVNLSLLGILYAFFILTHWLPMISRQR